MPGRLRRGAPSPRRARRPSAPPPRTRRGRQRRAGRAARRPPPAGRRTRGAGERAPRPARTRPAGASVVRASSNRARSARWSAATSCSAASSTAACTSMSEGAEAEPPRARSWPRTSPSRVTATRCGMGVDRTARRGEVVHDHDAGEQAAQRSSELGRRVDQVEGADRAGGGGGDGRGRARAARSPTSSPARPASSALSSSRAPTAASSPSTATASAASPEGSRDGRLVAGPHGHDRRDRAEQAGQPWAGGEQRTRRRPCGTARASRASSRAARAARSRSAARSSSRSGVHLGLGRCERGGGLLVLAVEVDLALVEPGDLALERHEVGVRSVGPVRAWAREPSSRSISAVAVLGRVRAAGPRRPVGPAPRAGRRRPGAGWPPALLGGVAPRRPPAGRSTAPASRAWSLVDLGDEAGLLLAGLGGLPLQLDGVAPRPLVGAARRPGGGPAAPPARSSRPSGRGPRPAGSTSPGPGRRRASPVDVLGLERLGACGEGCELVLDLGAALAEGALVGDLRLERRAQLEQVVGQQPEPGVALVGLDDAPPGGPPRPAGRAA